MPLSALESTQSITSPCVRPLTVHQKAISIVRQALRGGQERTCVRLLFGITLFREKGLNTVEDQQHARFLVTDASLVESPFAIWPGEQDTLFSARATGATVALHHPAPSSLTTPTSPTTSWMPLDELASTWADFGSENAASSLALTRQSINRAVNQCFTEHEGCRFAYEHLSVATMKFKARSMNAYLYASNLAHIPKQIAWNAAKRGVAAIRVRSAYSSQECSVCYYTHRKNRPNQQTFCCAVCGYSTHADLNAAINIERRLGDAELQACKDRKAVKALLMQRHQIWKTQNGWP